MSREVLKVLHWGTTVERLVRSKGVELVGKGVEPTVGVVEAVGVEVSAAIELIAPGAVVALDMAVELR